MFLKKCHSKKTGRTQLSIAHGYRNLNGKSKYRIVQTIGYLDELQKKYPDSVARFTMVAKQMDNERMVNKSLGVVLDAFEAVSSTSEQCVLTDAVVNAILHKL
ncbi:MAG: hypothetical protein FWH42_02405 [Dehalococcoidia bacterium]|nr:hypothetical protein [Dehalococcoidia bacterium]